MPKKKQCARCGKALTDLYASVWSSSRGEVFYCHDDDGTCYVGATMAGYPEMGSPR